MSFKELGLNEKILQAIDECGYTEPTPIQAQAIPHVLMMRDVVGIAQTGTGKTASFTLPMIEILSVGRAKARMPRSLILTPTRELAAQIAENFDLYGKHLKLEKALLVGGVSMDKQIEKLDRGVDVLIATPGRLLDLFERGRILLTDIKVLVIDEADRMLDMGFIPDIEKIVSKLPFTRQNLLFSATMAPEIRKLTEKFLSNPKEITVERKTTTAENVEEFLVWTHYKKKMDVLEKLIRDEKVQNAFIFCNRKRDISGLAKFLKNKGHGVGEIHGDMDQKSRTKTLDNFKNDEIKLLVCSDVVARGIDIDDVSHVFNFDVPMNAEDYVHRVGRTGRAGNTGRAWTLGAGGKDQDFVEAIEKLIKKKIEVVEIGKGSKGSGDNKKADKKSGKDSSVSEFKAPKKSSKNSSNKSSEAKPDKKKSNNSKKENDDDQQGSVTGFGDDVPGFFG